MKRLILILTLVMIFVPVSVADTNRSEAVQAIEEAEGMIEEMERQNISTERPEDELQQAQTLLRQATYAEFIMNESDGPGYRTAREALYGLDHTRFTYAGVVEHTEEIERLHNTSLTVLDRLISVRLRIDDAREDRLNLTAAEEAYREAKEEFEAEQYDDASEHIEEAHAALDEERARLSVAELIASSGRGFVEDNLWELIGAAGLVMLLGGVSTWLYSKRKLRRRLEEIEEELQMIDRLMVEAQEGYFIDEELSKTVYEARMETYQDMRDELENEQATVADRLGREPP